MLLCSEQLLNFARSQKYTCMHAVVPINTLQNKMKIQSAFMMKLVYSQEPQNTTIPDIAAILVYLHVSVHALYFQPDEPSSLSNLILLEHNPHPAPSPPIDIRMLSKIVRMLLSVTSNQSSSIIIILNAFFNLCFL